MHPHRLPIQAYRIDRYNLIIQKGETEWIYTENTTLHKIALVNSKKKVAEWIDLVTAKRLSVIKIAKPDTIQTAVRCPLLIKKQCEGSFIGKQHEL